MVLGFAIHNVNWVTIRERVGVRVITIAFIFLWG